MTAPRAERTATGRPLSPTRARLLQVLRAQAEPTGVSALGTMTGLHANTLREHLDGLVRAGLASRHPAPPGRGRPGWLYQAARDEVQAPDHAALAATLAAVITRSGRGHDDTDVGEVAGCAAVRRAEDAGRDWGRRLVRQTQGSPDRVGDEAARRRVVALFDDLGFAPLVDADATEVRLTRCPLLQAAHEHTDGVCSIHLGIARGALEEYGADPDRCSLEPFVVPGECLLRLQADTGE